MSIPKIIHQIWLGPKKRPDIWMNSWKINYLHKHPDWEYKLWTELEIAELTLVNQRQYDSEPYYTGKSDIARYEILNQFGGVFIDADSLWIEGNNISLNTILEKSMPSGMFCAEEPVNKWSLANGVIGFKKNHSILKNTINFINQNYFALKQKHPRLRDVWLVTGPKIFTEMVKQEPNNLILDSHYFYPESFHQNNLDLDTQKFHLKYPKSIMFQYGYTTNNISGNNVMTKFIENN